MKHLRFKSILITLMMCTASTAYSQTTDATATKVAPTSTDGSLGSASKALTDELLKGYRSLARKELFHRVAVPYFSENGASVVENKLGRVMAELLSVELAKNKPFVVVERERLDQVMKEYRLADLGIVDADSVAQFGKVMGAQTIISGSVSEAGASASRRCSTAALWASEPFPP